ncbi:Diphthamide synthesis protein [Spraguea lophii 42_110]|uniref:Diphthamide synthesis protein n=1 Tax=Spraguea lophii (strain 42_110) TaxID=1358809 RepID=S7W839_SPRLO|nr:Diphthamide synthesis protein [Spraguea lophii 42_110]
MVFFDSLLKSKKIVRLISDAEHASLLSMVYDYIATNFPNIDIGILENVEFFCPLKTASSELFIILAAQCPFHSVECISLVKELNDQDSVKDSFYYNKDNEITIFKDNIFVYRKYKIDIASKSIFTKNLQFYKYFHYILNFKNNENIKDDCFLEKIENLDRTRFLVSRFAQMEKIKKCSILGIFFTNPIFLPLAKRVKKVLQKLGKRGFLYFLRDVSETRLCSIDGIEAMILIDCQMFEMPVITKPVISPFELILAYQEEEWNGEYGVNEVDEEKIKIEVNENECTKIIKKEFIKVEYQVDNQEDENIYEGYKGIPEHYD